MNNGSGSDLIVLSTLRCCRSVSWSRRSSFPLPSLRHEVSMMVRTCARWISLERLYHSLRQQMVSEYWSPECDRSSIAVVADPLWIACWSYTNFSALVRLSQSSTEASYCSQNCCQWRILPSNDGTSSFSSLEDLWSEVVVDVVDQAEWEASNFFTATTTEVSILEACVLNDKTVIFWQINSHTSSSYTADNSLFTSHSCPCIAPTKPQSYHRHLSYQQVLLRSPRANTLPLTASVMTLSHCCWHL